MKRLIYIILFLLTGQAATLLAQNDSVMTVLLSRQRLIQQSALEFDIMLAGLDTKSLLWANATFQLEFTDGNYTIDPAILSVEYNESSGDIVFGTFPGAMPTETYYVTPRVFDGRISITVAGPDMNYYTHLVPPKDTVSIGRFRVTANDGSALPELLQWKGPYEYYQAIAYKLINEKVIPPYNILAVEDDNIEFAAYNADFSVDYEAMDIPDPEFLIAEFQAQYIGLKNVDLVFETESEFQNKGFIITRGMRRYTDVDSTTIQFTDTIATYEDNPDLLGLGTQAPGKIYPTIVDNVPYREITYCYELLNVDWNGIMHRRAVSCVDVPHALITYGQANPTPFAKTTTIEYIVEDNVYMTAEVYDTEGKLVEVLLQDEPVDRGKHDLVFEASDFASQGLYSIILVARPIEDPTVELSKAIVKAQLFRK